MLTIERILQLHNQLDDDRHTLKMIISNQIDYHLPGGEAAAITADKFGALADDILEFMKFKKNFLNEE